MTSATALHASEANRAKLPALLMRSTIGVAILLNLLVAGVIVLHPYILRLWVGEAYVTTTGPSLLVLVGAHCLRNIAAPYALMLLATGLHQRALVSALIEGVANLIASIVLGVIWGAIGVACGTLVGAVVGIAGTLLLNSGRTPSLTPQPLVFSLRAVVLPLLLFAPLHFLLLQLATK